MLRSVGRIVWVAIAFMIAVIAGIAALGLIGLERVTAAIHSEPQSTGELGHWADIAYLVIGASQWTTVLSIVPALLAIVVGELARIRTLIYWVAAGGLAAVATPVLNGFATSQSNLVLPPVAMLQILATAGFAAGVVYWALAGRRS